MSGVEGTQISATSKENGKQGHIYCGVCCDMRRAVMIVNILSIFNVIFQMVSIAGFTSLIKNRNPEDFATIVGLERAMTGVFIMSITSIFFSLGAFYGAFKYKVLPVMMQTAFTIIYFFVVNLMFLRVSRNHSEFQFGPVNWVIAVMVSLLFIYPHAMLITELRSGLMSAETYAREKHSCCCV